ncbi:hypothetical protein HG531_004964 [Fusarium graminearum]|nr:hypothetical protein HG531_004964 [Fusarium graminearum]
MYSLSDKNLSSKLEGGQGPYSPILCWLCKGIQCGWGSFLNPESRSSLSLPTTLFITSALVLLSKLLLNLGNLFASPKLIIDKANGGESKTNGKNSNVDTEATAILWCVVRSEDLSACNSCDVGKHDDPGHVSGRLGEEGKNTYMAIARARSSESSQANDIQAMLRGCEKVPKV